MILKMLQYLLSEVYDFLIDDLNLTFQRIFLVDILELFPLMFTQHLLNLVILLLRYLFLLVDGLFGLIEGPSSLYLKAKVQLLVQFYLRCHHFPHLHVLLVYELYHHILAFLFFVLRRPLVYEFFLFLEVKL